MRNIQRRSPVSFSSRPVRTENRGHWMVTLEYEDEGTGPYLIDLSHRPRWDLQGRDISQSAPFDIAVPEKPGESRFRDGVLINRMNGTQASVWHLWGDAPQILDGPAVTDITEASVFLALTGRNVFSITEKLTSLDLADPRKEPPVIFQGPFSHVPCQIAVLERDGVDGTILLACSRGYAFDMVHVVLDAGRGAGLRPAGENAFSGVLKSRNKNS